MILSHKRGLQTVPFILAAVLTTCATAVTSLPRAAQAATRPQEPTVTEASHDSVWPDQQNVSHSPDVDSETPALAVTDSGVVHIVWEEGSQLYHSFREAGSWSAPSAIPGTGTSEQPALEAGPSNMVHLVYVNDVNVFYADVFYVAWDGSSWSLPKNVSQTGVFDQVSDSPDLALASDGSVHVVTVEQTASGEQLYYASSDDGSLWLEYDGISSAHGANPSIDVADRDAIHVAYRADDDIYVLGGTVSGWSLPQNISNTPAPSTAPDLAVGRSGTPEVVWQETPTDTDQIQYSRGETWPPGVTLSNSADGASLPSLTIGAFGHRHVAWDDEAFPHAIRHAWTADAGAWPTPETVYAGTFTLKDVALDVGRDGVVHAAWTEIQGEKGDILYASKRFYDVFDVFLPLLVRDAGR